MRGGKVKLDTIKTSNFDDFTLLTAFELALKMETNVYHSLLKLHEIAQTYGDAQMEDFIEGTFLDEQVKSMKEISDYITSIKRCTANNNTLGEFIFDKEFK